MYSVDRWIVNGQVYNFAKLTSFNPNSPYDNFGVSETGYVQPNEPCIVFTENTPIGTRWTFQNGNYIEIDSDRRPALFNKSVSLVNPVYRFPELTANNYIFDYRYQGEAYLSILTDGNDYRMIAVNLWRDPIYIEANAGGGWRGPSSPILNAFLLNAELPSSPYGLIPESDDDGGYGGADYTNDDTDYSGLPTLSSSQVGFCSLYKMNQQQMADLADYLWGLSTGTIATFLPIFSNPMDCIIAVGIVPVEPETESQQDLIKVGNLTTTVWGYRITKQYDEIDMGTVEIGKGQFTNSFMDYSPYTKVELYLPYIGNVSLDTDEVMDSTIGLKYKFDLLSGSCVAEVKVTKTYNYKDEDHVHSNILYRYSGNFLANIPVNGENFSQMFNAVIGAVAMGINAAGNYKTGIASADMAKSADVSSARSDAASLHRSAAAFNGVGATSAMKPSIQRAGNVSSVCGFLAKQKPEIVLKLPKIANIGENQGHEVGYPRYGEYTIAELEGYSSIMMIHLKNIPCTDTERNIIENDLNSGVIFSKTAVPQHSEFQNTVKVYKFKCENICVNKADDWELIDTLTLSWRNPNIDVLNPTIRIEATSSLTKRKILREGNYVYIADFERYYYVKSMKAQAGNFIELELSVDACMSWLTNLRNQRCVVDRQEKVWNTYLNDEFMRVYNTPYTVVKEFPNGFSTQNFVLAVAGGGSTNSSGGDDSGGGGGSDF